MNGQGVEHIYIETADWNATIAFWKRFGYELAFETDHHSGSLVHPAGKPALFIAERESSLEQHLCLEIDDSAAFPLDGLAVDTPWTAQHWDVMEAVVRDPDGRCVSLQAPLPAGVTVDHHDYVWLGARPTIQVADVAATAAVFTDVLGWNLHASMGEPMQFAIVAASNASIGITESPQPTVPLDIVSVYVDVEGVDALHDHVATLVEITQPPTTHPWGQRDFVVRLPSGHLIAFGERI